MKGEKNMTLWLQAFAEGGEPAEAPAQAPAEAAAGEENKEASRDAAQEAAPEETAASGAAQDGAAVPAQVLKSVEDALLQKQKNAALDKIIAEWERSGEALKAIYPGFELKKELRENAEFSRLLQAGVSVRRAYEATNLESILGEALRYAAVTAGRKTAESMQAQQGRVQENSVLDRAASLERRDVNSLTKSDILNILDQVSRGAKIKF